VIDINETHHLDDLSGVAGTNVNAKTMESVVDPRGGRELSGVSFASSVHRD